MSVKSVLSSFNMSHPNIIFSLMIMFHFYYASKVFGCVVKWAACETQGHKSDRNESIAKSTPEWGSLFLLGFLFLQESERMSVKPVCPESHDSCSVWPQDHRTSVPGPRTPLQGIRTPLRVPRTPVCVCGSSGGEGDQITSAVFQNSGILSAHSCVLRR